MSERLVLVGMLDSPFVRRVAIALELAQVAYENLPLKTFGDAEKFAAYSPLKRAPTLVLESGEALFDSQLILAYLAERFVPVAALLPSDPALRLLCYQVLGAATGLADKAVSTVYEKTFHTVDSRHPVLMARARAQLVDTLGWLELCAPVQDWLAGDRLTIADVSVGTAVRFAVEAHPEFVSLTAFPRVSAWCTRLEALPAFRKTYLPLDPPSA
jgi:glutathione S-transferase